MEHWEPLTPKQKIAHFWDYHKGWIIGGIVALIAILYLFEIDGKPAKETVLMGVLMNDFLEIEDIEAMEADMLAVLEGDATSEEVVLDAALAMHLDRQDPDTMSTMAKVTTYVFAHELDFMIIEKDIVEHYTSIDGIYGEPLLLSEEFCNRYGIVLEEPYFCMVEGSEKIDETKKIVDWIQEEF